MCESNVYMKNGNKLDMIMENVIFIEPKNGKLHLSGLLGDEMDIDAKIKEIHLLDHKILLEK